MKVYSDKPSRIRVVDLETTGTTTDDSVVEIAAIDLIGSDITIIGSDLIRPYISIPPQASAKHHLVDEDLVHCQRIEHHLPHYMDQSRAAGVDVFASHNWRSEAQWLADLLDGRPAICTLKCSIRVWPKAPAHNNQALRYWLRPKGLSSQVANRAHRAFPNAYVTAFILRELLTVASLDELITWTNEPVLLPRVTFGKHRGADWSDVPVDYLAWVADKSDLSEDIKFTADHYRRVRQQQAA
jgi:exodeoxyribonuclease X